MGIARRSRRHRPEVRLRYPRLSGLHLAHQRKAFNPCAVSVGDIKATDEITTIEGLRGPVKKDLHPVQEAWLKHDVAQCGYCQPGQIMGAVALIKEHKKSGKPITDDDLDQIRNICRCGTYCGP